MLEIALHGRLSSEQDEGRFSWSSVNIVCVRITPEFEMENHQPLFTVSGYVATEAGISDVKTNNNESEARQ